MKSSHWIQQTHLFRAAEYICSACRTSCDKPYKTCPACGAPMKNETYDPSWVDEAEDLSALLDNDW